MKQKNKEKDSLMHTQRMLEREIQKGGEKEEIILEGSEAIRGWRVVL